MRREKAKKVKLGPINLERRAELEQSLIERKNWPSYSAKFHSWRWWALSHVRPVTAALEKMDQTFGGPIRQETDLGQLRRAAVRGTLEFAASYPTILGSMGLGTAALITNRSELGAVMLVGVTAGTFLNLKGEIEMEAVKDRLKELGLSMGDLFPSSRE